MVLPLAAEPLQLSWEAPTTNADGTALSGLTGYVLYDAQARGAYDFTSDGRNHTTDTLEHTSHAG